MSDPILDPIIEDTIQGGNGRLVRLKKGQRITLINKSGAQVFFSEGKSVDYKSVNFFHLLLFQVVSLLAFNPLDATDHMSLPHSRSRVGKASVPTFSLPP